MKKIIVLLVAVTMLMGCATVKGLFTNNEADLQLAVHIATAIVVKGHPADAAKITAIVTNVQKQIATGTLTSANIVQTYVASQLTGLNLAPTDQVVMNDLLGQVQTALVQTFTKANITAPADQLVEINKVLAWVLEISTLPTGAK